ncbi:MAG: hypothetical protein RIQ60_2148 [Pseudomonadota bacterium]
MPDDRSSALQCAGELLIFPCNGNGVEALSCLGRDWRLLAFVDDDPVKLAAGEIHGHAVCDRHTLRRHPSAHVLAVPGSPRTFRQRRVHIDGLGVATDRYATVVHPGAHVSPLAHLGRNVLVMAGVVITANAVVGDHVCILPNTVVHHDVVIGDWSLIGSQVTLAGGVHVGANCYVGSGSSVKNGLHIGNGTLVGLGSVVIRDTLSMDCVAGSPARALR